MVTLGVIEFNSAAYDADSPSQLSVLARRRLGNTSLLEWVARRVSESQLLGKVVVVAGEGTQSELARQCTPTNITLFVSRESDPQARLISAARRFSADSLVRVCVNNPFVDPVLIDRLVAAARQAGGCDYVGYCGTDGRQWASGRGMLAEWCSLAALERAMKMKTEPLASLSGAIAKQPKMFKAVRLPAPKPLAEADVRLTIDVEEDWDHAQQIYEALGPESLDWQDVTDLLDRQPAMRERMAVLNRSA